MPDQIQWLLDRAEIENLAILFGRGIDIDASYFDRCLLEDVEVEFPFGSWKGLAETKRLRDSTIAVACAFTCHHITNPIIDIHGNSGRGEYYVIAAHGLQGPDGRVQVVYGGVIYTQDVVRTPAGWRVRRHQGKVTWIDDAGGLMQAVGGLVGDRIA